MIISLVVENMIPEVGILDSEGLDVTLDDHCPLFYTDHLRDDV